MLRADSDHKVMRASDEQDRAAGGRDARLLRFVDGIARASVELKRFQGGLAYWAYLRWCVGGKTKNLYLGRVFGHSRAERLAEGWRLARERFTSSAIARTDGKPVLHRL